MGFAELDKSIPNFKIKKSMNLPQIILDPLLVFSSRNFTKSFQNKFLLKHVDDINFFKCNINTVSCFKRGFDLVQSLLSDLNLFEMHQKVVKKIKARLIYYILEFSSFVVNTHEAFINVMNC